VYIENLTADLKTWEKGKKKKLSLRRRLINKKLKKMKKIVLFGKFISEV